jgi:hypothetical protein
MTDGRGEYLQQTLASFDAMVTGTVTRKVIHDDSGDPAYAAFLKTMHWDYEVIGGGDRLGYTGAVQRAWAYLDEPEEINRFTFHLEDDFIFNEPIDLDEMSELLDEKWWLAQVSLRRDKWGTEEVGFIEEGPGWYHDRSDVRFRWMETRRFYTMNPHLYKSRLRMLGWPDGDHGETNWSAEILRRGLPWQVAPEHVQFGVWGHKADRPHITHIGYERKGFGY